ncbi:MAG: CxxC-x17-CxxC domain-containing protein [archaeon]
MERKFDNKRNSFGRGNFKGRSNFGRSNFGGPREMHKAICAKCKKECEVPFKPTEGRDVFCKDCFVKRE